MGPRLPPFPLETFSEWLSYSPDSGELWWKKRPANNAKMDQQAGVVLKIGYRKLHVRNHQVYAHHVAWFLSRGEWPVAMIDHVNGNRTDNRAANLRLANQTQQNFNTPVNCKNTSGVKGVSWASREGLWRAYITQGRKQIYLGNFSSFDDAVKARKRAEKTVCKEFVRIDEQGAVA